MASSESDNIQSEKPRVNLDTILVEEIGQFGKFQIRIIAQCLFICLFASWNINEFLFTTARTETRCLIRECEDPNQIHFAPSWIGNAVPLDSGSVDNCYRFGNTSVPSPGNDTCPSSLFDTKILQPCEEYVYENTNTVVYDFDLACDEWRRALIGSVRVLGMMVALGMTGYISDRWGRRRALVLNAICAAVLGILRYWAASYNVYVLLLFLESATGLGAFTCAYVLTMELIGPKYRVMCGAIMSTTFAIGQVTLSLIAWAISDWRTLILAIYIPQFLCILYFWTRMESVRWLMNKGRFDEAEILLKEAARLNGKQLSQKSCEDLRKHVEEEMRNKSDSKDKSSLVILVLREKKILIRFFVTCLWWITSTFVYYGLSFNAMNLTGNMYFNYMVVCAVEIPGFWIVVPLICRIGRKPMLIAGFWLCAICQAGFIFIPNDLFVISLVIYMLGKFAISVVIISMCIFTLELYPTEYRQRLYNFSSMVGRMGSIVAPLTPALAATLFAELPFILFGGLALLAGCVTFLVPETLGSELPDTMDEALNIVKRNKQEHSTKL